VERGIPDRDGRPISRRPVPARDVRPQRREDARSEPELDELEPPPPPAELLDDELPEEEDDRDDEELEDDELEGAPLLLELDAPLDSGVDVVLEPSGPVGEVPHPTPNIPTPARATPPDRTRRNCRRSSRLVAASTGCGFSDRDIHDLLARRYMASDVPGGRQSGGRAAPS